MIGQCRLLRECSTIYNEFVQGRMPNKTCGYVGLDPVVCCPSTETSNINSTLGSTSAPYVPLLYIPPENITNNNSRVLTPTTMESIIAPTLSNPDNYKIDNLTETEATDTSLESSTLSNIDSTDTRNVPTANDKPVSVSMFLSRIMPESNAKKIGSIALKSENILNCKINFF